MNFKFKQSEGFTLIELSVVIFVFLILLSIAGNFILESWRVKKKSYSRISATEEGQRAIRDMTREIRESSPGDNGDYNLITVDADELSFYSNVDADEQIEQVRYFLEDNFLKKGVIEPAGDPVEYLPENENIVNVASDINNSIEDIFVYYDGENNLIIDPASNINLIRLVEVYLEINSAPELSERNYIISTSVQIRNLKDNL